MFSISPYQVKVKSYSDVNKLAPIDQFDAQDFNLNECGVIRNDISKLARAQSQAEFDAIMRKVGQIKPTYSVKDGQTIHEVFDSIRPRQLQTPSELAGFAEYLVNMHGAYNDIHVPDAEVKKSDVPSEPSPSSSES